MQEITQILLSKIPDPKYQAAYVAHMTALVKAMELAASAPVCVADAMFAHDEQAMRAALMRFKADDPIVGHVAGDSESKTSDGGSEDGGWRTEGLPDIGDMVEVEIATGEIMSGEVVELDPHDGLDLLVCGTRSMPGQEPNPALWRDWTGPDIDNPNDRRVRWRIMPASAPKTQDEGWHTEGFPAIGDMVEIEVETGELLSGEVVAIDKESRLDLRLRGADAVPEKYRSYASEGWWTGAFSNKKTEHDDPGDRRIRWRKIPN